MMYIDDAIEALRTIVSVPEATLRYRSGYNVGALSFTAGELTDAIRNYYPEFEVAYEPDERQEIANSWPEDVDDTAARNDWGWEP